MQGAKLAKLANLDRRAGSRGWALAAPLLALSASSVSCGAPEEPARVELVVYAATSLRDALQELGGEYERARPVELVFHCGSSGDLARQIVAARAADVFLSAGEAEMDFVAAAGLLEEGTRRALLSNQLVVIEPAGEAGSVSRFAEPFAAEQLAAEGIDRLSLAHPEAAPAGRYAKAWLERRGVWERVRERVVPAIDVRAALAAVESGGAQAGIVYRTDAAQSSRVRIVHAVRRSEGPPISYPCAVLKGREHAGEARAWIEFLATRGSQAVFERHGFLASSPGD